MSAIHVKISQKKMYALLKIECFGRIKDLERIAYV
jgi:hypothetical protein